MEAQINEAALAGNVDFLHELLQQDPQALDRFMVECYAETPLHVAAGSGQLEFVQQILHRRPELAGKLDPSQSLPLHLAAREGHLEVVQNLVQVNPNMCFHLDQHRRNPLHIAAINGHVDVLKFLVESIYFHEFLNSHEFLNFYKFLNFHEFLNSKDYKSNTILHLAVSETKTETIRFLTNSTSVEVNALNDDGSTALDISTQTNREDVEIGPLLRAAGAKRSKDIAKPQTMDWIKDQRGDLMIVATLIAAIAFQVGMNPPGGVWQEKLDASQTGTGAPPSSFEQSHKPGESIMGDNYPGAFRALMIFNTIGFIASLSVTVLLISGLPFKSKYYMWILMVIMWAALTAMALTYVTSIYFVTPISAIQFKMLYGYVIAWAGLLTILLLTHIIRLIKKAITRLFKCRGIEERPQR